MKLKNLQLSQLSSQQLDELVVLVNERGTVFFRDYNLTTERQVEIFEHLGFWTNTPHKRCSYIPVQRPYIINKALIANFRIKNHSIVLRSSSHWRTVAKYTPEPMMEFHADTSFEINCLSSFASVDFFAD
jgi:sulfonate dioxygenase